MKRIVTAALAASLCLLGAVQAHALTVSLAPPPGEDFKIHPGETMRVDVIVSGLHTAVPDAAVPPEVDPALGPFRVDSFLGAFGFDLLYDPALLRFTTAGASAGTQLGQPGSQALYRLDEFRPGVLSVLGVSLLDESPATSPCAFCAPPYLRDLQSDGSGAPLDGFRLLTLAFVLRDPGLPVQSSTLDLGGVSLGDAAGLDLPLRGALGAVVEDALGVPVAAPIAVAGATFEVPEPGAAGLLLVGVAAWLLQLPRRRPARACRAGAAAPDGAAVHAQRLQPRGQPALPDSRRRVAVQ